MEESEVGEGCQTVTFGYEEMGTWGFVGSGSSHLSTKRAQ